MITNIFVLLLTVAALVFYQKKWFASLQLPTFYRYAILALGVYHLAFTALFHFYIIQHGGDSPGYWYLTIDNYKPAETWMEYWGYGNFFMQWLNYIPSKILGLSYLTGNILYGLLGYIGFRELLLLGHAAWAKEGENLWDRSWVLLLFAPNLHFWTAGVGKETLLFLGLVLCLVGIKAPASHWPYLVFGFFLSFLVRPLNGAVILVVSTLGVINRLRFQQKRQYAGLFALLALAGFVTVYVLVRQTHMPDISWASLREFTSSQLLFLEGFGAVSYIPIQDYTWPEKIVAVLFRPLPWEARGVWQWAAALENSLAVILILLAIGVVALKRKILKLADFLYVGMGVGALLVLAFALTLNNLGILMRMKSIFMVFFYLLAWNIIFLSKNHYTYSSS